MADELASRHLLHVFPTFAVGGAQSRLVQLIKAYQGRYRHSIVSLNGCFDMAAAMPADAPVKYLTPNIEKNKGLRNLKPIRDFIAGVNPDVLVTYNWGAIEWALAGRWSGVVRHIHIEDGFGPEEQSKQLKRRVIFRRLALSGGHTSIVLPSNTLMKIARDQWRLPLRSLRLVPNGIDCIRFSSIGKTERHNGSIVIGTVASLRPEKNLVRLIAAFAATLKTNSPKQLRLLIVGDGSEREHLQKVAQELGCADYIQFAGASKEPEMFLAAMDIFAMSSDTEQMPLVVIEAMASGLPIVSTAVGDINTMVAPENSPFITKLGDDARYQQSLQSLLDDPQLQNQVGEANQLKAFAEFNYKTMASSYAELFG